MDRGMVWLLFDGKLRAAQQGTSVTVESAEELRTFSAFDGKDLIVWAPCPILGNLKVAWRD
ncbi:hypothetical protein Y882_06865 [Dyella japonica DSM 16301]|uniref:Uncharacterized protein n=1 Tax=Dyella japonica DSM 16301 TaxID=1440762 RepID=A0A0G9H506_9GAMM|nr:hypothetical protein Y882_06865 [Dyella japonica DSM 16301]